MASGRVIEHSIEIDAPGELVFDRYRDVANWPDWDPDTAAASLDGDFVVGSKGKLKPSKGMAVPMVVTEVTPGRSFTVESKIPFLHMVFTHELTPRDAGVVATHRVALNGAMLWVIGRSLERQIDEGLPVTLRKLKAMVEQAHGGNSA